MFRTDQSTSRNTIETILVLALLIALFIALYDVLKIFFGVFTFALIFSVSFAGPFERLSRILHQRRKLAAVIYSLILLLIIALPFIYLIGALGKHIREILHLAEDIRAHGLPPLPEKIAALPILGDTIASFREHLQENPREALVGYELQLKVLLHHILTGGAGIIGAALQFILGIIISAFVLTGGEKMLEPVKSTLKHLLGKRDGLALIDASLYAIRGVSIGVMSTAFIAAILSWGGFAIAGLHFQMLLSALVFFLVLIQAGPLLVWVPLVIWMASLGHTGMAIFLGVYGVLVLVVDAILKPILIAKSGGKLPFLVLFIGVVGGLAAWGFTGMFKGAIIMAVFYTVFNSWLGKKQVSPSPVP